LRDSINTLEILRHNQTDPLPARSQLIPRTPLQWVIVALVKALNVVAIEALVTDLHPGTQRAHRRKFLDRESDRLRCGRKPAIFPAAAATYPCAWPEQLGGCAVVECRGLTSRWTGLSATTVMIG